MDYANGTELWKYQWDLIHNPETILLGAYNEEEGASELRVFQIDLTKVVDLAAFSLGDKINCITPGGSIIELPSKAKLYFTGQYKVAADINKELFKGCLLGFETDAKYSARMSLNTTTKSWEFDGYVKVGGDVFYSGRSGDEHLANVIIGKEDDSCNVTLFAGDYIGKPYPGEFKQPYVKDANTSITNSKEIGSYVVGCLGKHARRFYDSHRSAHPAYQESLLRIANLIHSVEEQDDNVFSDYERYCRAERSEHYYGSSEVWAPEYYELFADALEAYINDRKKLEELILAEKDRDRMTDLTWLLITKYSTSASYNVRLHVLEKLSDAKMWGNPLYGNGEAYLALRIVDQITEKEAATFIKDLQKDNLMQNLCANINNFGIGGDDYTKFVAKLISIFYSVNVDRFTEIYADVEGYYYARRKEDLELWFTWRKSFRNDKFNLRYAYDYEDNKLVFTTSQGHWVDFNPSWTRNPIDPFDILIVTFDDVPEHICDNCLPKGETVLMPAFLFEWICNEYSNQQIVDYLDKGVTVTSLFIGVGAVTKSTKLVNIISLIIAAGNVALLNDDFEDFVTAYLSPEAFMLWNGFSILLDVSNPISTLRAGEALNKFSDFVFIWDAFKTSPSYNELMNSDKAEMIKQADLLIFQIKTEQGL